MTAILVIKHGALGDLVQAFAPFAAIRAHHPGARIDLLTTPPFAALMERAPWFDRVLTDDRPDWWNLPAQVALWAGGEATRRVRRTLPGVLLLPDLSSATNALRGWRTLHPGA